MKKTSRFQGFLNEKIQRELASAKEGEVRRRDSLRERWEIRATPSEIKAVKTVELLLLLTTVLVNEEYSPKSRDEKIYIFHRLLHEHFPLFAREVGRIGSLYKCTDGASPAVALYLRHKGQGEQGRELLQYPEGVTRRNVERQVAFLQESIGNRMPFASLLAATRKFFTEYSRQKGNLE